MFYNRVRTTVNSNNQNNQNTRKTYVYDYVVTFMLQFTKYINKIMAANISDTDVIIDTEGITVPECAHGMTFSNSFHAQIIVTEYFL